jgi:hypothetical protein
MRRLPYRTLHTSHGVGSAALSPKMGQPAERSSVAHSQPCETPLRLISNQSDY